ncbi:serine/threonine-protein kinase PINK1, mitochondrial [Xyrauchen texanus]|uniref:serine/threonine-protein kinase PINK1, mitochondrial n=1 Tax=Xyrauchen texanus TaxID=154827 RepID=UPI002241F272|nr:serine/threonine-protein kinase PINK1, mitochondrial [Xyrauchen texanus]
MSVKHALSRCLELGRSVFQLGLIKPAGRVAAKLRGERLRVSPPTRTVQPQSFLPARYRFYRLSLSGLAARLQSGGFRRLAGGGSPRNRAVFLAFGVGLGLIEQQLEEDRKGVALCQEIQAVFRKKKFQTPLKSFTSGYKLEDYAIGKQIGKGCNAAVYEAAAPFAVPGESGKCSLVQLNQNETENKNEGPLGFSTVPSFPLAVKMMWNIGAGSSSDAILKSMSMELVPACTQALTKEKGQITLDGHFGLVPKRLTAHPNVITVYRAFTAEVPLLPGAQEEYPDVLPARLNPLGLGSNRTLFLVMKNYPCTLRQYLKVSMPDQMQASLMLLQLLEGVDHLCRQGIAHRDLKSDNVLLEFDCVCCPRLVITDFGCCLAEDFGLKLPFNSRWVSKGGNSCLMAPEVATAVPGPGVTIDYSKADAWAVGAIAYELFGQPNPFYSLQGLESRSYQERQLPPLPDSVPAYVQLVVALLLCRNNHKRPSARVAANMLHICLWGKRVLASLDWARLDKMIDWLLCQSAVVLLKSRGSGGSSVEAELQRSFLANIDLEDLRTAASFLMYGQAQWQTPLMHYTEP